MQAVDLLHSNRISLIDVLSHLVDVRARAAHQRNNLLEFGNIEPNNQAGNRHLAQVRAQVRGAELFHVCVDLRQLIFRYPESNHFIAAAFCHQRSIPFRLCGRSLDGEAALFSKSRTEDFCFSSSRRVRLMNPSKTVGWLSHWNRKRCSPPVAGSPGMEKCSAHALLSREKRPSQPRS